MNRLTTPHHVLTWTRRPAAFRLAPVARSAALLLVPGLLWAQAVVPVATLTPAIRSAVIENAAAALAEGYVDAGTGRAIGDALRARLEAGAYDALTNPAQFAEVVTHDLRATNGDLHLSLRFSPTPPAAGRPAGDPFADAPRQNFGLGRAEILDGNVGYLEITSFMGASGYQEVVVDALRFLSRADAVIIDLRRNGGGSGEMTHFMFSHFFGATPVPTIRVRSRSAPDGVVRQSLATVPGPRRPEVPLFLLVSQRTASAAEEFSFVLKNRRRATLIGSRTAGAGHMVAFRPIGHGFTLGVSITRVSDPETGLEWEQVGVQPDIAVPAEQALLEGHAAALRAILATTTGAARARLLTRLLATADARRKPVQVDARRMARFAGTYEGRVIAVVDGHLAYTRVAGGLSEALVPLGGDRFALGATQLLFEERAGTIRLTIDQADGTQITLTRSTSDKPSNRQ